jgi:magnesium transporter
VANWVDLLDPDEAEIRKHAPHLASRAVEELLRPADPDGKARPTLQGHGDYVFGILLLAVLDSERDLLYYQEVDVVLTRDSILTVRKTPPGREPFDPAEVHETCQAKGHVSPGHVAYHLIDAIAERYLDLLDDVDAEIDELEENLDTWESDRTRSRLSEIRHDLLRIRRTLAPTRDAVRGVVDGRVDIDGGVLHREVFPDEIERAFAGVLDKLLRATESLEFSRDLLAAVRDYQATQIANKQNEITQRLGVVASLLLVPTFIVGVYGQNFKDLPETSWHFGYGFSWALIVVVTIAQLAFFRWKKWI